MSAIRKRVTLAASGTPEQIAYRMSELPPGVPSSAVVVDIEHRIEHVRGFTAEHVVERSYVTFTLEWPA